MAEQFAAMSSGTAQQGVYLSSLRKVRIPLAPRAEQRRIVAKLDDLLARSRRAKDSLAEIPALLERYRQSVLTEAFRGELTADWRAEQTPSSLPYLRPLGDEVAPGDRAVHNGAWPEYRLDQLVEEGTIITYGIVLPGDEVAGGVPYVRQQDIFDGRINVSELRHTSQEIANKHARSSLRENDVLLCIIRHLRVAIVPKGLDGANVTQGTVRIRCRAGTVEPEFVALYLQGPQAQKWMKARYFGMAMPRINVADARAIPIPLPSIEEQGEVVRRMKVALAAVEALRDHTAAVDAETENFSQTLLNRAFRGELVPQDPADEPASVLLDRIRAQRASVSPPPRRRGREKRP